MTVRGTIADTSHIPADLQPVMAALCETGAELAQVIARGPLGGALGEEIGQNTDGDNQKALDVMADDVFAARLKDTLVKYYASEEQDDVVTLNPNGKYALAIDPLDGSSNIDVNVSIGTIFSIYEAKDGAEESFLRPASEQLAGGFIVYGPQTGLVVTFGNGTQSYVLDPVSGEFTLVNEAVKIAETTKEFAINASNMRHWVKPVRAYIDDCLAGEEGPRGRNFNMRWIASLVADTNRILSRGGIFLYPSDTRDGYKQGRLRMVYEVAPIAFLIEQAGGHATDGIEPIMSKAATELHGRSPFVFGTAEEVDRVSNYHDLPEQEISAIFGKRGLFRG